MDREEELGLLYESAVALMSEYVGRPPLRAMLSPAAWAGDWARRHPDEAKDLASGLYKMLQRYFSSH